MAAAMSALLAERVKTPEHQMEETGRVLGAGVQNGPVALKSRSSWGERQAKLLLFFKSCLFSIAG